MKTQDHPPLDIEEAIDLILALPAHRSANPGQAKFGMLLITDYLFKLRDDFKDDARAYRYLTSLIPLIASAVRAFSVEHDIFGTRWASVNKRVENMEALSRNILIFSPFNQGSIWGKVVTLVIGVTSIPFVKKIIDGLDLKTILPTQQSTIIILWMLAGILGLVVGLVIVHFLVLLLSSLTTITINTKTPDRIQTQWARSLSQYRKIIKTFVVNALLVRAKYYPAFCINSVGNNYADAGVPHFAVGLKPSGKGSVDIDSFIDSIIKKHFSFEP